MEQHELSLEAALQKARGEYARHTALPPLKSIRFNNRHRVILNELRHGGWTRSIKFYEAPRTHSALMQQGLIERRDTAGSIEFRITQSGLDALRMQR